MEWPRFVMFKSLVDNKCLFSTNTLISFTEVKELGWHTAHEFVMAKCGGGLVHIRNNGKYWRGTSDSGYIYIELVACAPEEDQSSAYCTLFKPSIYTKEGVTCIQLQHLRSGQYSFVHLNPNGYCVAGKPTLAIGERLSVIAVSWVSFLIKFLKDANVEVIELDKKKRLPRFVVFKSAHNNRYLCCEKDEPYYLKFNGEDAMDPYSNHEVVMAKCGYGLVHIKCCATGKYWGRISENENSIVAGADEKEEDLSKWSCTLFWTYYDPKEDDNVVQLQFSQLGENTRILRNCLTTSKSPQTQEVGLIALESKPLLPKSLQCQSVDDISANTGGGVSNDGIDAKIGGGISVDDINKIVGGLAIEDDSNTIIVGGVSIKISEVVYELKARFVASSTTSRVE